MDDSVQHDDELTLHRRPGSTTRRDVLVVDGGQVRRRSDLLATEEPLEVRVLVDGSRRTAAITMRTPGADFELAAGFLHGEQIIGDAGDIRRITYCVDREIDASQRYNIVNAELRDGVEFDVERLERHFYTTSACGICGKASLDALHLQGCPILPPGPQIPATTIAALPAALRSAQRLFDSTGGLHAAGLFTAAGTLLVAREDVGRHNAVDKVIGWALLQRRLPLRDHVLMVSGRSSYEILQKALVAGIPVVCAVSAPSSLAVALAEEFRMTLIGFLRDDRFNIYTGAERIDFDTSRLDAMATMPAAPGHSGSATGRHGPRR